MPVTYRRPGVYLEESLLVNQPTTASAFTVAAFVGVAGKGPVNEPIRVDSWSDFVTVFGGFGTITPPAPPDPNDITTAAFGATTNYANLTALKADATKGDGHYTTPAFTAGQYVTLLDNSKANYSGAGGTPTPNVWVAGPKAGTGQPVPVATTALSYLPFSVYSFFQCGGRTAWIVRSVSSTTGQGGKEASISVNGSNELLDPLTSFTVTALSVGVWGNSVKYSLGTQATVGSGDTAANVFVIQVYVTNADGIDEVVETFAGLSVGGISSTRRVDVAINDPAAGSQYIRISDVNEAQAQPAAADPTSLAGGVDPGIPDQAALMGSADFVSKVEGPVMLNIVGFHNDIAKINTASSSTAYIGTTVPSNTWPERQDIFIVNDSAPPRLPNQPSSGYKTTIQTTLGANPGDSYSASYGPWILIPHPQKVSEILAVPPGGAVLGVASRIDSTVGVFRAPAGVIAGITNAVGVQTRFTDTELGDLNAANINIIRSVPGAGICIMGGRTRKSFGVDHYISARRTLIFIKELLTRNTQFAVFENNDEQLWASLRMAADRILRPLWSAGGLKGVSTGEAYFIRCDDSLNTPSVIAAGEVRMEVGVALQYPAEFVIIRLTQYDRGSFANEIIPTT